MSDVENPVDIINQLVLDLSLATSLPTGPYGRNYVFASAAANSMAYQAQQLDKKDLRGFEWTIEPLLKLVLADIDDIVASKAAFAIRALIASRVCMKKLLDCEGLINLSRVMDLILSRKGADLKTISYSRSLAEHIAVCYREIARFHPWQIVDAGVLRHCVLLLKIGDVTLQTISATTMASLSTDIEICKQMFSYGAIKPLMNITNISLTNEACVLAGLGCIVQLCKIFEISPRMIQQGVVAVLERTLFIYSGHNNQAMREKSVFALNYLSMNAKGATNNSSNNISSLVKRALGKKQISPLCTDRVLEGLRAEFKTGTLQAKISILQFLLFVHNRYPQESEMANLIREDLLELVTHGPWFARNLCLKVICVVYGNDAERELMVERGIVEVAFESIRGKHEDLQEAPLVVLLHFCMHPKLPVVLLQKGAAKVAASLVERASDPIIKELAIILLKALKLFNQQEIFRALPKELHYLLQRDEYNPQLYGAEYGGLIQLYFQEIIENRRAQNYLVAQFTAEEKAEFELTDEDLERFQNLFMELDIECKGMLGADELKMLLVLKGEVMDREEIQDLLIEYSVEHTNSLNFKEFVMMMRDWENRFGVGFERVLTTATKRGAIGKSRNRLNLWLNRDQMDSQQILQTRERRYAQQQKLEEWKLQYNAHEQLLVKREREHYLRQIGANYSPTYEHLRLQPNSRDFQRVLFEEEQDIMLAQSPSRGSQQSRGASRSRKQLPAIK